MWIWHPVNVDQALNLCAITHGAFVTHLEWEKCRIWTQYAQCGHLLKPNNGRGMFNSFALRHCEMYRNVGGYEDSLNILIQMRHCRCIAFGLYYWRSLEWGGSEANKHVNVGLQQHVNKTKCKCQYIRTEYNCCFWTLSIILFLFKTSSCK
jgi:hypothetical protein